MAHAIRRMCGFGFGERKGGKGEREGRGAEKGCAGSTYGPIFTEAPITRSVLALGDLHHDFELSPAASHEPVLPLEVTVATSMSITNPAQLVAE